jgi:hypothetical protein
MQFAKRLRDPVMCGEITCSVRIWRRPQVKAGRRYRLGPGVPLLERRPLRAWISVIYLLFFWRKPADH